MSLTSMSSVISSKVDLAALGPAFRAAKPFNYVVIDDFFQPAIAQGLAAEFPEFDSPVWAEYNNAIEIKKLCNRWDSFPKLTYSVFSYLNSPKFVESMGTLIDGKLFPDPGLNGGGWHTHKAGGKLNTHLDYSIHPKLGLERRINIIIYVQPDWKPEYGGALGLWAVNDAGDGPGKLEVEVPCLFNRAVIFDTSQNSWHGLPEPVRSPEGTNRNSIAAYFLCEPRAGASERGKALFAPFGDQVKDDAILELIRLRSQVSTSASVYGGKT